MTFRIPVTLEIEALDPKLARHDAGRIVCLLNRAQRGDTVVTHAWIGELERADEASADGGSNE